MDKLKNKWIPWNELLEMQLILIKLNLICFVECSGWTVGTRVLNKASQWFSAQYSRPTPSSLTLLFSMPHKGAGETPSQVPPVSREGTYHKEATQQGGWRCSSFHHDFTSEALFEYNCCVHLWNVCYTNTPIIHKCWIAWNIQRICHIVTIHHC